jgi:hypothetical protein
MVKWNLSFGRPDGVTALVFNSLKYRILLAKR